MRSQRSTQRVCVQPSCTVAYCLVSPDALAEPVALCCRLLHVLVLRPGSALLQCGDARQKRTTGTARAVSQCGDGREQRAAARACMDLRNARSARERRTPPAAPGPSARRLRRAGGQPATSAPLRWQSARAAERRRTLVIRREEQSKRAHFLEQHKPLPGAAVSGQCKGAGSGRCAPGRLSRRWLAAPRSAGASASPPPSWRYQCRARWGCRRPAMTHTAHGAPHVRRRVTTNSTT